MALLKIRYNCGCGEKITTQSEAEKHADKKGHVVGVLGEIVPEGKDGKRSR